MQDGQVVAKVLLKVPIPIQIDRTCALPVYQQIIDQIELLICSGQLDHVKSLPSVRSLAAQIHVNPNTVAKAYRLLEEKGTLHNRPGSGCYLASGSTRLSESERLQRIQPKLTVVIQEAVRLGITDDQLLSLFESEISQSSVRQSDPVKQPFELDFID